MRSMRSADGPAVAGYLRDSAAKGENFLFGFGPEADFKDSTMNIGYAMQGGLGLPDRGYYFDADKKDKLAAYEKHVAKVLELSGVPAADAATQAKDVLAFETRLAKASKSSEEMSRDVSLYYNPVSPADADKLTPNFSWTQFFAAQGVATPKMFSLAVPAFHQEVSRCSATCRSRHGNPTCASTPSIRASPYLSAPFVQENYEFNDKTYARPEGAEGTLEARARHGRQRGPAKRSARCTSRSRSRPNPRRGWKRWCRTCAPRSRLASRSSTG